MRWRVGQDFRRLHQAAHLILTRRRPVLYPSCLAIQPLHHSICPRCPPVLAAQAWPTRVSGWSRSARDDVEYLEEGSVGRSTHHISLKGGQQKGDVPRQQPTEEDAACAKTCEDPSPRPWPPPDLLTTLDAAFFRWAMKHVTARKLQKLAGGSRLLDVLQDRKMAVALALHLVKVKRPKRALWVLFVSQNVGSKLKQNAYEVIAHQLAETSQWGSMFKLIETGRCHTGRTTVRLLNWYTRALLETHRYTLLEDVIARFEKENLKPNRRTFHHLISGHIRNRNLTLAKRNLAKMEEAGFPIDSSHIPSSCLPTVRWVAILLSSLNRWRH
ncbi:hypothetical protein A0H81_00889 [Grifola frondosa]|uniref:Pentatricopeptide repeat-containing protein n=1 Tax=Grifola frondosa TaxID=5627 RepID=A0A1C7MW64_GRIFR|nr:hypothetical protein A0H81_00889 [Grifola frondosa]